MPAANPESTPLPELGSLQQAIAFRDGFRWPLLAPALLTTVAICALMVALISTPQGKLAERATGYTLDFVRVKRPETVKPRETKPDKPQPPAVAPPPPMAITTQAPQVSTEKIPLDISTPVPGINISGVGFNMGAVQEAEYLPIVKIAPTYPGRALNKGLQGHCTVEYTVTTAGTTRDIHVVEDDCSHFLFKRASIEAAQKFRYQPKVINGKAVEVPGIRNRFLYQLEQ